MEPYFCSYVMSAKGNWVITTGDETYHGFSYSHNYTEHLLININKMENHLARWAKCIHSFISPGNWHGLFQGNSYCFEEWTAYNQQLTLYFTAPCFFNVSYELLSSLKYASSFFLLLTLWDSKYLSSTSNSKRIYTSQSLKNLPCELSLVQIKREK